MENLGVIECRKEGWKIPWKLFSLWERLVAIIPSLRGSRQHPVRSGPTCDSARGVGGRRKRRKHRAADEDVSPPRFSRSENERSGRGDHGREISCIIVSENFHRFSLARSENSSLLCIVLLCAASPLAAEIYFCFETGTTFSVFCAVWQRKCAEERFRAVENISESAFLLGHIREKKLNQWMKIFSTREINFVTR